MKLSFRAPYVSIKNFPDIELPSLTIVTGLNGAGKTHLLRAIKDGQITTDAQISTSTGPLQNHIRYITNTDQILSQPAFNPNLTVNIVGSFNQQRDGGLQGLQIGLRKLIPGLTFPTPTNREECIRITGAYDKKDEINALYDDAEARLRPWLGDTNLKTGIPLLDITEKDLRDASTLIIDQFSFDIANLFGRYRDSLVRERLRKMASAYGKHVDPSVSEKYSSTPPWRTLTDALHTLGMNYTFDEPDMYSLDAFIPTLRKDQTGEQIAFASLSSGERELFRFALAAFTPSNPAISVLRPKVILADEIDASLHPDMVKRLITFIQETLISEFKITCILTTHSLTTVALSPEESIHEMVGGDHGLVKISKQAACSRLSFGVPTLSIDFDGRRQVFTESETDARIFESLFAFLKSRLSFERQLNFVSAGFRQKNRADLNSGAANVKAIVRQLDRSGNKKIYGIIDWDKSHVSDHRVRVLAERKQYAIENVLLDPLLIALLLIKERKCNLILSTTPKFVEVAKLSLSVLQKLADELQTYVFPNLDAEREAIRYHSGVEIQTSVSFNRTRGHDLEKKLALTIEPLQRFTGSPKKGNEDEWQPKTGALMLAVIEHVISELPQFCPAAICELFEWIANTPD